MAYAVINATQAGSNEIVAAVAEKVIRVLGYQMSAAAAETATWKSAATSKSGPMAMATGSPFTAPVSRDGYLETAKGEALNLNLLAGNAVGGFLIYELV